MTMLETADREIAAILTAERLRRKRRTGLDRVRARLAGKALD